VHRSARLSVFLLLLLPTCASPWSTLRDRARQCPAQRGDCDLDASNGCEADLRSNRQHCAACGRAVPTVCLGGLGANVTHVSTGPATSCAALSSESRTQAYCWGANDRGQAGGEPSPWRLRPATIGLEFSEPIEQIAVGDGFACALAADSGRLQCWGDVPLNQDADAGLGIRGARGFALGARHGCVALGQAAASPALVQCFGDNDRGQLGGPSTRAPLSSVSLPDNTPLAVSDFMGLSAGSGHTCAWSSRAVWCWGANESGQLGRRTLPGSLESGAAQVSFGRNVSRVLDLAAGAESTCVVVDSSESPDTDGGAMIEDASADGAAFDAGDSATRDAAVSDAGAESGAPRGCFEPIVGTGAVYCWGALLADAVAPSCALRIPTLVRLANGGPLLGASRVFVGAEHACAIVGPERAVHCWGRSSAARMLGAVSNGPMTATEVSALRGAVELAITGAANSAPIGTHAEAREAFCARFESRRVAAQIQCWGPNDHGQLGDPARAHTTQEALGDVAW
jgi:alpha-tubulin suppressor-like RCC1 family protein